MTTMLVTGGTGPLGRQVADRLRAGGRAGRTGAEPTPVRPAGKAYAGYRRGDHLSTERAAGKATFEEFLAARFSRPE
ncbi:hypothetical protein [Streptomyces atratus]